MKKTLFIALAACALLVCVGCKNSADDDPAPVAVESVTLNVTTLSLAPGEKEKLTATVTPDDADDKSVKWSSDNTSVASVDYYGTVKAVKVGTANITAQAGGKTATCVIKVHTHSYSNGKCTVCGFVKPSMPDGEIDDDGVLTKYTGSETAVVIPDGVTGIGEGAFSGCTSLTSVKIPSSVTSIGTSAFWGCENLASVAIPASVTSIGTSAFAFCTNLASVTILASVTSIGDYAFRGCTSLASVTIPEGVTSIGSGAFYDCMSLESVTYGGTKDGWGDIKKGDNIFYGTNVSKITCKDGTL